MNTILLTAVLGLLLQQPAVQRSELSVAGPAGEQRITPADLARMPRVAVTVDDHGTKATFEGVELRHLLEKVGAPLGEKLRGRDLTRYVVVEAADGYRVLFALAELDAGFSGSKVILADKQDGNPRRRCRSLPHHRRGRQADGAVRPAGRPDRAWRGGASLTTVRRLIPPSSMRPRTTRRS